MERIPRNERYPTNQLSQWLPDSLPCKEEMDNSQKRIELENGEQPNVDTCQCFGYWTSLTLQGMLDMPEKRSWLHFPTSSLVLHLKWSDLHSYHSFGRICRWSAVVTVDLLKVEGILQLNWKYPLSSLQKHFVSSKREIGTTEDASTRQPSLLDPTRLPLILCVTERE